MLILMETNAVCNSNFFLSIVTLLGLSFDKWAIFGIILKAKFVLYKIIVAVSLST